MHAIGGSAGREGRAGALRRRAQHALVLLAGALLLCLPAFYNGHPIIFADLLDYIGDSMKIVRRVWPSGSRPPYYGVAIEALHWERSLWPVVIAQGLVVSYLLWVVLRVVGVALGGAGFLLLIAGLTLLTSLPWYVSHVMPDIFGGVLVLSLFLLAFGGDRLSLVEKLYFAGLAALSILFHLSFIPVGLAILALAVGFRLLRGRGAGRPRPVLALAPVLLAAGMSAYVSHRLWGNFSGPPYAPPYLLAHVLVDGPGKEYLQRTCGEQHLVLCDYQDSIPDDVEEFMFRVYSPYHSTGLTKRIRDESKTVVFGTARMFPWQTFEAAARSALTQMVTFSTEVAQLEDISDGQGGSLGGAFGGMGEVYAGDFLFVGQGYKGSKQELGLLDPEHLRPLNSLHYAVVVLSALLFVILFWRSTRQRDWMLLQLLSVVGVSVLLNALVTGAAVGVFGRFAARVIWLLPFAVCAAGLSLRQQRRAIAPMAPGLPVGKRGVELG